MTFISLLCRNNRVTSTRSIARVFVGPTIAVVTQSSSKTTTFVSSMSSTTSIPYPRAAVATTLQWSSVSAENSYLLVQRANPPDQGLWSIPGGKLEVGETTIDGAKRELQEETQILPEWCDFYEHPFLTTDAIFQDHEGTYKFHYVIAQCFAKVKDETNIVSGMKPSDDALDAKWWTVSEMEELHRSNRISVDVLRVIERAEELSNAGLLLPT
jgi:ADP-ribose pyrophosphatase YjhB (NUDIX family)